MGAVAGIEQLKGEIPAGTALEQLASASELADRLRARGDELLDQLVDAARASGASWTEIGCSLGTSKQAAHERFGALADPPDGQAPFGLSGTATDLLTAAADEARDLGHHFIKPDRAPGSGAARPARRAGRRSARGARRHRGGGPRARR